MEDSSPGKGCTCELLADKRHSSWGKGVWEGFLEEETSNHGTFAALAHVGTDSTQEKEKAIGRSLSHPRVEFVQILTPSMLQRTEISRMRGARRKGGQDLARDVVLGVGRSASGVAL